MVKTLLGFLALLVPIGVVAAGPDVFVPSSSIALSSDKGVRAHTNFEIFTGTHLVGGREDLLSQAIHGPLAIELPQSSVSGYGPVDIRNGYDVPPTGGSGAIAVIDAYDYPTSLNDFNVFSAQFGLPQESSGSATLTTNNVFEVAYQGATKPAGNASWNEEEALDIEWAHAMAPYAKIYLVEANSSSLSDLFAAVQKAVTLPGVREVSMSFGSSEFAQETSFDSTFVAPGVVFFAAAGDASNSANYPATSPNVVGVGGTTLTLNGEDKLVSEVAWSDGGGGKSLYEKIPKYQAAIASIVGTSRGAPDIALNADPGTGCAVYDSTPSDGFVGWQVFGGTSLATPCCAGIANASGRNYFSSNIELTHIYSGLDLYFRDIVSGSSGNNSAKSGWDFCTGVGVPIRTLSL